MLIEKIKAAQLQARKEKNEVKKSLLTTLIGEAEMVGKNSRNGSPTDEEVVKTLKKFEKNLQENLKIFRERGMQAEELFATTEMEYLLEFLPTKVSDDQIKTDIVSLIESMNLKMEQKSLGQITKELKIKYGSQFDGGQISSIFKSMMV